MADNRCNALTADFPWIDTSCQRYCSGLHAPHFASCIALPQLPPLGYLCAFLTRSGHRNGLQLEIARFICVTATDIPDCHLLCDNAQHVWRCSMLQASCNTASHCSKRCPASTLQLWIRKVTETGSRVHARLWLVDTSNPCRRRCIRLPARNKQGRQSCCPAVQAAQIKPAYNKYR